MRRWTFLLCALVGLFIGCGGPPMANVSGNVLVDGKPLNKGTIEFTPAEGEGDPASVAIVDGRYEVKMVAGNKQVRITAPVSVGRQKVGNIMEEIMQESLPDRYHVQSELKLDVKPGANTKDWSLESKARRP
jgi:hypothetical protein